MSRVPAVSGIVLAGGASRRFGGDKLAEPVAGVPLLDRAVRVLAEVAGEVVVVAAPGRPVPGLAGIDGGPAIRIVTDPEPFGGPLAGVRTGLAAARGSIVIVVGGDMPSIVPAVLRRLLERAPAALADEAGILRPLPCTLDRRAALVAADRLLGAGERRLRSLLAELGTIALSRPEWAVDDPDGLTLVDVDERTDLPDRQRGPDLAIGASPEEEPGP